MRLDWNLSLLVRPESASRLDEGNDFHQKRNSEKCEAMSGLLDLQTVDSRFWVYYGMRERPPRVGN